MEIKEGMKFNLKEDLLFEKLSEVYFIHSINENRVFIRWEGASIQFSYSKQEVEKYFENGTWILINTPSVHRKPLKQDKLKEHELMDRTSMILTMFVDFVLTPSKECLQDEALVKEIETISENLWTLYQKLGNL